MTPTILFFARNYQSSFFPLLISEKYKSVYIVKNKKEKLNVLKLGGKDVYCFEDEFDKLDINFDLNAYLEYSFGCDRFLNGLSLSDREFILKKEISFVRGVFEFSKPQFIINEPVAIELAEIIAIEARKLNIKYLSWMSFPKKNTFYWQEDPFHNSIKNHLEKIIPTENNVHDALELLKGVKDGTVKPFYTENISSRFSVLKLFHLIKSLVYEIIVVITNSKFKRKVFLDSSWRYQIKQIKFLFNSVFYSTSYDDLDEFKNKELIFYPLHYEPEAVLFYMSYFFDNQAMVIENTLKCLNQNQFLVVKEHPQQLGLLLDKRFREIKKRYPNLIFIKGEEKTVRIMNRCSIIITLGSTAGFESLALGKKVINLGRIFYDAFEGVNNCKSFDEIYDLIRGNKPFNPSGDFEIFVAKMMQYIKEGNPFPHNELYSPKNINLIRKAIEDEIQV